MERTLSKTLTGVAFTALFAALISAGAFIAIPIGPVPITLQNLFSLLAGLILGPVQGGASVGMFILAGVIGVPVFANTGSPMGFARLAGPTGGYLAGYLAAAVLAGLIAGIPRPGVKLPLWRLTLAVFAGLLVVYVPGLIRLHMTLEGSWQRTLAVGFYPFVIGDIIKGVIAVLTAPRLRRTAADLLSRQK